VLAAAESFGDAPKPNAGADTRAALELLLELGMQVLDGDTSALLGIAPALAIVMEKLDGSHRSLRERAMNAVTPFSAVLGEHAEQRRQSDLRELDLLAASVSEAEAPSAIGRSVVVAALVLLSNLNADQRWHERLAFPRSEAEAA
jgi:hypothetical protein